MNNEYLRNPARYDRIVAQLEDRDQAAGHGRRGRRFPAAEESLEK